MGKWHPDGNKEFFTHARQRACTTHGWQAPCSCPKRDYSYTAQAFREDKSKPLGAIFLNATGNGPTPELAEQKMLKELHRHLKQHKKRLQELQEKIDSMESFLKDHEIRTETWEQHHAREEPHR